MSSLTITPSTPGSPQQVHLLLPQLQHQLQRGPAVRCTPVQAQWRDLVPVRGVAKPFSGTATGASGPDSCCRKALCAATGCDQKFNARSNLNILNADMKTSKNNTCAVLKVAGRNSSSRTSSAPAPRRTTGGNAGHLCLCGKTMGKVGGKPMKRK